MDFNNKIVYQIYPKSFHDTNDDGIGDIPGIIAKLEYIANLDIDYIWLCPINCSPQKDNGYDISDYYNIDPMYGTIDDFKQLVYEAKKFNIEIMIDLVLNHVSDQSKWFINSKDIYSKYHKYFIWRDEPNEMTSHFDPNPSSAWTFCEEVGKYYFHLFDKHQPDLNWDNPQVRSEIKNVIEFWSSLGINAYRLDAIDMIGKNPDKFIKSGGPKLFEYLQDLLNGIRNENTLLVGECCISSIEDAMRLCDCGLTQVFHFENVNFTEGDTKWVQSPVDYKLLAQIMDKWTNSSLKSQTWVMNNHDLPRLISKWGNDKELRYECATCYATLFGLLDGTQYIYQGEEIGMTNPYFDCIDDYRDIESLNVYEYLINNQVSDEDAISELKKLSRDNSRVPMQWDDSELRGFSTASPWIPYNQYNLANVEIDLSRDKSIYAYYQSLIAFKKEHYHNYIKGGIDEISCKQDVISFRKHNMWIICNMSEDIVEFKVPNGKVVFNNYEQIGCVLQPYQSLVIVEERMRDE